MQFPSVHDFAAEGPNPECYLTLDGEWSVAVADVIASTKMAAAGRDRDVNFVAAAVVAALSAVVSRPPQGAACQFGGDGAVAAVPPDCRDAAAATLSALAHWAATEHQVPLRVGLVPVSALREAGMDAMVALHDFGNGNSFGLFLGDGVAAAESWVKADPRWQLPPKPGPLPGLEGLSCRWSPVPARRGVVLCVIADAVAAGAAGMAAVGRLQAEIEAIVPTTVAAPMGTGDHIAPRAVPTLRSLRLEASTVEPGRRAYRVVRALVGAAILATVHHLGGRLGKLDVIRYRHATAERTDYRKQAGGPRLVLDVTFDEAERIEAALARAEAAGEIIFGTARSDATCMTCLVGDFMADRHVHFVDGQGLGFWRASVVLKGKRVH